MNNIHKPKVFTARESGIVKVICLTIATFITIIALLSGNGIAFILVVTVAFPLFLLGVSIQPQKQNSKVKSDRAIIEKIQPQYNEPKKESGNNRAIIEKIQQQYNKSNNYIFSKFTLYLIAILIAFFGIYELSNGETQSVSSLIVAIALANHAQLRD